MTFCNLPDFETFHSLLCPYYRDGEDENSSQEELDGFIGFLWKLLEKGIISGAIARQEETVGFVLWAMDTEEFPFSNKPGCGTIVEIGILPEFRKKGYGGALAAYAESDLGDAPRYVCAYGPAEGFWKKCGYRESGETAKNGLKIFVKG